jgi:hypothetical protein
MVSLSKDFRKMKNLLMEEFSKQGRADQVDIRLTPKVRLLDSNSKLKQKGEILKIWLMSRGLLQFPAAKEESESLLLQ